MKKLDILDLSKKEIEDRIQILEDELYEFKLAKIVKELEEKELIPEDYFVGHKNLVDVKSAIDSVLLQHPDGLKSAEIAKKTGRNINSVRAKLSKDKDVSYLKNDKVWVRSDLVR